MNKPDRADWEERGYYFAWGKDDSDPARGFSGLTMRVDHLTGCQYLDAASLTPRLGRDGKQVCKP